MFTACAVNRNSDTQNEHFNSKIFMGVLRATRSDTDTAVVTITLERYFWAAGKLKSDMALTNDLAPSPDHWSCLFLDAKGRTLKEVVVSNPLKPHHEYASADGKLESKTLSVETASFVVRTEITDNLQTIRIVGDNNQLIGTLTLKP
jgi:hypothetical protein